MDDKRFPRLSREGQKSAPPLNEAEEAEAAEEIPSPPPPRDPLATLTADRTAPNNAWMVTLADLLALILTFFVLLYSMSVVYTAPWEKVTHSLSQRLNPKPLRPDPQPVSDLATPGLQRKTAENLDYLHGIIREKIRRQPDFTAALQRHDDRLVISLDSDVYFRPGEAELQRSVLPVVAALSNTLGHISNRIDVYGHTDPRPINTTLFPSNWELSLARAATIADAIARAGYRSPIRSFGLASARFDEISADLLVWERYRLARRVDIVIREYMPE